MQQQEHRSSLHPNAAPQATCCGKMAHLCTCEYYKQMQQQQQQQQQLPQQQVSVSTPLPADGVFASNEPIVAGGSERPRGTLREGATLPFRTSHSHAKKAPQTDADSRPPGHAAQPHVATAALASDETNLPPDLEARRRAAYKQATDPAEATRKRVDDLSLAQKDSKEACMQQKRAEHDAGDVYSDLESDLGDLEASSADVLLQAQLLLANGVASDRNCGGTVGGSAPAVAAAAVHIDVADGTQQDSANAGSQAPSTTTDPYLLPSGAETLFRDASTVPLLV